MIFAFTDTSDVISLQFLAQYVNIYVSMIPGSYLKELRGVEGLTELFDIDPSRADLVKNPAIGRRFLLIKAKNPDQEKTNTEETNMKLDLVKKILSFSSKVQKADLGEKASALLGDITDALNKGQVNEEEAAGLLAKIEEAFDGDNISKEQFNDWSGKVAKLLPDAEVQTVEVEAEAEETEAEAEVKEAEVEKAEETEAEVEKEAEEVEETDEAEEETEAEVEKQAPEEDPSERIRKYENDLNDAKEEIRKAHEEIQKMQIEKKRNDLIKKSETELKYIGKSAEDTADLFIDLHKAGVPKDVFDKVYDCLKTANEMIDKSGFFDEKGTALENEELEGDPEVQLMKEAREAVDSGEYDTIEKAYAGILTKDPSRLEALERE